MNKILMIVDMQNDFITGSLANSEAEAIIPNIQKRIEEYKKNGDWIVFTRDTHKKNYLDTPEGKKLPIQHCIKNTWGWEIDNRLDWHDYSVVNKPTFGSLDVAASVGKNDEVEICGTCTDICVVSCALMIKNLRSNVKVIINENCCAGTTRENHDAAIAVMRSCQIDII